MRSAINEIFDKTTSENLNRALSDASRGVTGRERGNGSRSGFTSSTFIAGCILMILAASHHLRMIPLQDRQASFHGNNQSAASLTLPSAGFFIDNITGLAACFHCNLKTQPDERAIQEHAIRNPDCPVHRLLRFAGLPSDSEEAVRLARSAASGFRHRLSKLSMAFRSRDLLEFVESFGFSASEVELAMAQLLLSTDRNEGSNGHGLPKPGKLIDLMHSNRQQLSPKVLAISLASVLDSIAIEAPEGHEDERVPIAAAAGLETQWYNRAATAPANAVGIWVDSSATKTAAMLQQDIKELRTDNPQAEVQQENEAVADDLNSQPTCLLCRYRQRSQLTLPCGHFVMCAHCCQGRHRCPQCGTAILKMLTAYPT